jgi:hypothetical protein
MTEPMTDRGASRAAQPTPGWAAGVISVAVVGITVAVLSAIANFVFIPYYPLWSLLIIALDVLAIWALAAYGGRAEA